MSLPDLTKASIKGRALSLTDRRVAFSVLTRNSYSPVSGASSDPCQLARNSCENPLNDRQRNQKHGSPLPLLGDLFERCSVRESGCPSKIEMDFGIDSIQRAATAIAVAPSPATCSEYSAFKPRCSSQRATAAETSNQVGDRVLGTGARSNAKARFGEYGTCPGPWRSWNKTPHICTLRLCRHPHPRTLPVHPRASSWQSACQRGYRSLAHQGARVMIVSTFPRRPMTRGTFLPINLFATGDRTSGGNQGDRERHDEWQHQPGSAANVTEETRSIGLHWESQTRRICSFPVSKRGSTFDQGGVTHRSGGFETASPPAATGGMNQ